VLLNNSGEGKRSVTQQFGKGRGVLLNNSGEGKRSVTHKNRSAKNSLSLKPILSGYLSILRSNISLRDSNHICYFSSKQRLKAIELHSIKKRYYVKQNTGKTTPRSDSEVW